MRVTGLPRSTLYRALKRLEREGKVVKVDGLWMLKRHYLLKVKEELVQGLAVLFRLSRSDVEALEALLREGDVDCLLRGVEVFKHEAELVLRSEEAPEAVRLVVKRFLPLINTRLNEIALASLIVNYRLFRSFASLRRAFEASSGLKAYDLLKEYVVSLGWFNVTYLDVLEAFFKALDSSLMARLCEDGGFKRTMDKLLKWIDERCLEVPWLHEVTLSGFLDMLLRRFRSDLRGLQVSGFKLGILLRGALRLGEELSQGRRRRLTRSQIKYLKQCIDRAFQVR